MINAEKILKTCTILLLITLACGAYIVSAPEDNYESNNLSIFLLLNGTINNFTFQNVYIPSMEEYVAALVNDVNTFYIYNITDDSINLSDDDLMARGGDCKDWSEYYIRHLTQYNTTTIQVNVSDNVAHRFVIVSSATGYCLIDQTNYYCNTYKR